MFSDAMYVLTGAANKAKHVIVKYLQDRSTTQPNSKISSIDSLKSCNMCISVMSVSDVVANVEREEEEPQSETGPGTGSAAADAVAHILANEDARTGSGG